ncbi:DUF5076 domain-containing protein [Croceicoccus sp. Ery15]|uniref:DUF5076 domain-containing protein n=1 Tax=Croceicoccus sp. Ery15 TaxID=1703338 RepID=UPI001E2FE52A|nr:DUF5076 domain-containing protein [Croceicoccus sp. Ery15]
MFGRKPAVHAGAIDIVGMDFLNNSQEVARLWVEPDGPATCLIQPDRLEMPEMFGMLLVDSIRHGARAYAQCHGMSEEEALRRIWAGVDMERETNTTGLDTVQDYERPQ